MLVKDFQEKNCCSGPKDTTIQQVLKSWIKNKSNFFAVLDEDDKVLGVITLYDILKKLLPFYLQIDDLLADFAFDELLTPQKINETVKLSAEEVMTTKVVSVAPDDNFLKAATEMFSFEFDYLPVIDEDGKFSGMVTRNSLEEAILTMVKEHVK